MGRFLTLTMLMILGAMAVRTQQTKNPYTTKGLPNGVSWRESSDDMKTYYVRGVSDGITEGVVWLVAQKRPCVPDAQAALPFWYRSKDTIGNVVREMDSFYEDGVNVSLPVINAYVYTEMKLSGITKEELDYYLKRVK